MRLGILSDTHDQVKRAVKAVARLAAEGAEALVHCGDLTGVDIVQACGVLPAYFVFGNNDFHHARLSRAMAGVGAFCLGRGGLIELGGRTIAVTHGDSVTEVRRLQALAPDYLLSGHSHVADDHSEGPTRFINPGALYRASPKTVAILDLDADALITLTIGDEP